MIKIYRLIYKWIDHTFLKGCCPNIHSLEVRRAIRSKQQHRSIFKQHGLPYAEGMVSSNPLKAFRFVKNHGYPVVVKPNVGGFSRGSYFPITNKRQLARGIIGAKRYWPRTVIESYLSGHNYRISVFDGEIVAASERFPPFVIGDGKSTINELIEAENQIKRDMNLLPTMHEIPINRETRNYLKRQKLNLTSIPAKGQRVQTFHQVALKPGGVVHNLDVLTSINEKNQKLFKAIPSYFGARLLGIDVIMEKGASIDYDKQKCIFLEVNPRPYMQLHAFPRWGEKVNIDPIMAKIASIKVEGADIF